MPKNNTSVEELVKEFNIMFGRTTKSAWFYDALMRLQEQTRKEEREAIKAKLQHIKTEKSFKETNEDFQEMLGNILDATCEYIDDSVDSQESEGI